MKKQILFTSNARLVAIALIGALSLTSCRKDDDNTTTVEESEAVDAVSSSLSADANGMAKSMETATIYAEGKNLYTSNPSLNCGQLYSDSYAENYSSASYSYNYNGVFSYQLSCGTNGAPQSFAYKANRTGSYDTPRMSSDDNAVAEWKLTTLDASSATTLFNGSYVRTGTQVSKVRNQNTFSSTLTYALTDIAVNKSTHKIASGKASLVFSGTSSTGNQYTYNGAVTFNGNNTATLVINGNTYTINL
ncbi:MAG: hypothetical protein L6262_03705 [Weeksellaceae bacterium]|nr:hypothetical protein [Weeksellaceae bacterium]